MRKVQAVAALGTVVLLALAAGCNDDSAGETGGGSTSPIKAGDQYVALGDSYAAGPRLGKSTGPAGCAQTTGNYPHLLAAELELDLVDVSCGGASSESLGASQTPANGSEIAPQLDAVSVDTDLVTLTIGGNDGGLFATLTTACVGLALKDPDGTPCTDIGTQPGSQVQELIDGVAGVIQTAVEEIQDRARDARVVVVGYPQVFGASGGCDLLPLAKGDLPYVNKLMKSLVDAQQEGARTAGVEYVDVWSATAGHDICSDDPWVAGVTPQRAALAYHPYAEEQRKVADLLVDQVSQASKIGKE